MLAELSWTDAEQTQAIDRSHRIGQTEPVTAWRIIAAQTIDARIAELIDSKAGLADRALDGSEDEASSSADVQLEALVGARQRTEPSTSDRTRLLSLCRAGFLIVDRAPMALTAPLELSETVLALWSSGHSAIACSSQSRAVASMSPTPPPLRARRRARWLLVLSRASGVDPVRRSAPLPPRPHYGWDSCASKFAQSVEAPEPAATRSQPRATSPGFRPNPAGSPQPRRLHRRLNWRPGGRPFLDSIHVRTARAGWRINPLTSTSAKPTWWSWMPTNRGVPDPPRKMWSSAPVRLLVLVFGRRI